MKYKKILILGSGALKIGEAGEFDYSGSQAIKAVKEEGIKTVLINPNIATVQTDEGFADEIYYLPVTPEFVEKVIKKENPDAIMLSFGGQTALNCGLELKNSGVLEKYNIEVLGTPTEVIDLTEDRKKFNKTLDEIDVKYAKASYATNEKEALKVVKKIGYPVLVRAAFTLGGLGSGFAENEKEFKILIKKAFSYSPQITIDESLKGWKEVEYEVVRDKADNCITVCNMENFDPMGIHTGESIVIAPSQTLSNEDYHLLRDVATKTIRHLGIIGECNIQYAYNPKSYEYRVIEVNARLSRSSALASKATGYPLAYVAGKIALGYNLDEIKNPINKTTSAFFEPSLDYVVMKFPKWDLAKFDQVSNEIGSEMKSVGEVMSIGRNIEEVFQKAIRNLAIGANGLVANNHDFENIERELTNPTPDRVFAIVKALKNGKDINYIHKLTGIDLFFLDKIKNIVDTRNELLPHPSPLLGEERGQNEFLNLIKKAKKQGFSDKQIAILTEKKEEEIRKIRIENNIVPCVKQIDTLAGEYPTTTNYLYTSYHGNSNDIEVGYAGLHSLQKKKKILVLGSGAYRIGSSVEFDWCGVNTLDTLKNLGYETIMLNFNPETVSTDFEKSDKLYFDEISLEKVLDIYEIEKFDGVILSVGGQIANNLALDLEKNNIPILGTSAKNIDNAEDRNKFSGLLDKIGVDQPKWGELTSVGEAIKFAKKVDFPVLIRPSYVLSGANMKVCSDENKLKEFLEKVGDISAEHPAVISKFEQGAKEIEIDGVAKDGKLVIYAIGEHIENAGVHSGDATIAVPAQRLYVETVRKIKNITKQIIKELNITGPFNIQYLAIANDIKVIECNLRASRSFPFVSKITKYNFIEIATKAIMGINVEKKYNTLDLDYVGIKASQFSFHRLKGADPILGVEMSSTGEVGCLGTNIYQAFLKAMISVGVNIPNKNILLTIGGLENKVDFLKSAKRLIKMGYKIYSSLGTTKFLLENGIESKLLKKDFEKGDGKYILDYIEKNKIDLVIDLPYQENTKEEENSGYLIRRKAVDSGIPVINNIKIANLFIKSIEVLKKGKDIEIMSYDEFKKEH